MSENETIAVEEERTWAVDMTQDEFNFEYEHKYPNADVIPDVKIYLNPPLQEDRGMEPMGAEEYEEDGPAGHALVVEVNPDAVFTCPGCGFVAKKKFYNGGAPMLIGIKAHMRKCKEVITNG